MKIAYVSSSIRGETDRVLTAIAGRMQTAGATLSGIVKEESYDSQFDNGCDMKVRVLPAGPIVKITQELGAGSDACRLDPAAIAEAVSCVERQSLDASDLFILNKFGPEEAAGRGFVTAIAKAVEADVPVLVGVGKASLDAFQAFCGGDANALPADADAIMDWCEKTVPVATN